MKKETQEKLFCEFTKKQLEIIKSKSHDYAGEDDTLSNFKTAGANAGITTQQQILSLIATKVARLGNLLKGKEPNNESIDDTVIDMANYVFLLHCSLNDDPNKIHIRGVKSDDGDLFTDMGLTKELTDINDVLKIERNDAIQRDSYKYAGNIYRSTDEPLGWPLHPNVKKHFEETQQLINDWREGKFRDNCY